MLDFGEGLLLPQWCQRKAVYFGENRQSKPLVTLKVVLNFVLAEKVDQKTKPFAGFSDKRLIHWINKLLRFERFQRSLKDHVKLNDVGYYVNGTVICVQYSE